MKQLYKDNENLKNQLNFNFLANNVKGLQSTTNRLTLFRIYKNKKSHKGILFLQEIQSSIETERNGLMILMTEFTLHIVRLIYVAY